MRSVLAHYRSIPDPIIVKALTDATIESIESKIIHRAAWIATQQRQFAKYVSPLPAPECASGEGYRYLGRQYRLLASILHDWIARKDCLNSQVELRVNRS